MLQTKILEKSKTHILCSVSFPENPAVCETSHRQIKAQRWYLEHSSVNLPGESEIHTVILRCFNFYQCLTRCTQYFGHSKNPLISGKSRDKQCTYKRNTDVRSSKYCFSGKAIRITHSECLFSALGIQHAMRKRHIVICGLPVSAILSNIISLAA